MDTVATLDQVKWPSASQVRRKIRRERMRNIKLGDSSSNDERRAQWTATRKRGWSTPARKARLAHSSARQGW